MSKNKMTSPTTRAYNALASSLDSSNADASGYLRDLRENLLPGIDFDPIRKDIEQGAGNELKRKFLAIHSSTALAVNAFGYFDSSESRSFKRDGVAFNRPTFERRCPTGLRGTAPNLDVWFDASNAVVAVESKLTEYFQPKQAKFSDSYCENKLRNGEDCWWEVLRESKSAEKRCLDVAQLVKHYFGLRRHMCDEIEIESVELLYVFWEPTNYADLECCVQHREEIRLLTEAVEESEVKFSAHSYSELWLEWEQDAALRDHVANLRKRYEVEI